MPPKTRDSVGLIPRSMYRELTGAPGTTVFDSVGRGLTKRPSFGSKSYSTDDVPTPQPPSEDNTTASAPSDVSSIPRNPAIAKLFAQPSHNMFSAPQPGAKPISRSNTPVRASTVDVVAPTAPTPTVSRPSVLSSTYVMTAAHAASVVTAPAPVVTAPAPMLRRQLTINDLAQQQDGAANHIRLYDGERYVRADIVAKMGIKKAILPSVTCAEFDQLHSEVKSSFA